MQVNLSSILYIFLSFESLFSYFFKHCPMNKSFSGNTSLLRVTFTVLETSICPGYPVLFSTCSSRFLYCFRELMQFLVLQEAILSSNNKITSLTNMLIAVEYATIWTPRRVPKIATFFGSWLRMAKIGSMNILPSISTIIACTFVISPEWIMGPRSEIPSIGLAT